MLPISTGHIDSDAFRRLGVFSASSLSERARASVSNACEVRNQLRQMIARYPQPVFTTENVSVLYEQRPIRIEEHSIRNQLAGDSSAAIRLGEHSPNSISVIAVPRCADGKILLALRHLYPSGVWSLELPQFCNANEEEGWREPVEKAFRRCGIEAGPDMSILGLVRSNPRQVESVLLAVLAEGCRWSPCEVDSRLTEPGELFAGVAPASIAAIHELVRGAEIECAATLATIALLFSQV